MRMIGNAAGLVGKGLYGKYNQELAGKAVELLNMGSF